MLLFGHFVLVCREEVGNYSAKQVHLGTRTELPFTLTIEAADASQTLLNVHLTKRYRISETFT